MKKNIKMLLYGTPGVGKSVFALNFEKPFFITTDDNYGWLEEFGAKEQDHIKVNNWVEFEKLLRDKTIFDNYETIVIDLIEDLFMWKEEHYCKANGIKHVGDQQFGKGYSLSRNEFYIKIREVLDLNKNVILLSHESYKEINNERKSTISTYYSPSSYLPAPLLNKLAGNLRYVLRAKFQDIKEAGDWVQERVLSLAKDTTEFAVIRGVNMQALPETIPLEYEAFAKTFNIKGEVNKEFKTLNKKQQNEPLNLEDEESIKEVKETLLKPLKTAIKEVEEQSKGKEALLKRLKEKAEAKKEQLKDYKTLNRFDLLDSEPDKEDEIDVMNFDIETLASDNEVKDLSSKINSLSETAANIDDKELKRQEQMRKINEKIKAMKEKAGK